MGDFLKTVLSSVIAIILVAVACGVFLAAGIILPFLGIAVGILVAIVVVTMALREAFTNPDE